MRGTLVLCLVLAACASTVDSLTAEGERQLRANDLVAAELAYNKAIARDPHHAPAIYGKAWALYTSGIEDLRPAAKQLFQRAIDYDPDYWGGWRGKGVVLLDEGQLPAAEQALREAFARGPNEPQVLESLGLLYLDANKLDEAQRLIQAAVDRAPDRGELRRFLAEVAIARGDLPEARAQLSLGRESPVSGQRGLILLDDGEARLIVEEVTSLLRRTAMAPDELDAALRSLDRADSLLDGLQGLGIAPAAIDTRRKTHGGLRKRLEERRHP